MKKFVSILMALLFVLGICVSAMAEDLPKFSGLVVDAGDNSFTVISKNDSNIIFEVDDPEVDIPEIGAMIDVEYSGSLDSAIKASAITVLTPANVKTVSGTVTAIESGKITVKPAKGDSVICDLISSTVVSGKAETYNVGDAVTVTYAECVQFISTINLALAIEVTAVQPQKTEDPDVNKKMTGVVTNWTGSRISIRTSKGKTWTFKINSHTKYPSRKELEEGCTVSITYDGHASSHPYAKKVKVTKTVWETEHKIHKKTGTCGQYAAGWCMVLENGTYFDLSNAKNSGNKNHRGTGYKVTIYYYVDDGTNYATKLKWK